MFNEKVVELLNNQINKELYSGYLYLHFANYYNDEGLVGFANWYEIQAHEEFDHAMLFREYMHNNNLSVTLEAIDKPDLTFADHMAPLKEGLAHEEYVTALIHAIYDVAHEDKDYRTMQFLDWFVKEQAEEETNAHELISKMELFGGDNRGLYLLDQELAGRTYSAPDLEL